MTLFPVLLLLAALLPPSLLQDDCEDNGPQNSLTTREVEVQEEIVNTHNQLRRMVSPPGSDLQKMQWDDDAQVNAQRWADNCVYQHSPISLRTTETRCGENLFMSSYPASWSDVIQNWYDENEHLNFGVGPKERGAVVGHYTQVVWNSTRKIACGFAECPDQPLKYFYVCQYCPPGNYVNRLYTPYTEGTPCASCPADCEDGLCVQYEESLSL
ncbi:cysteine-rich secretory protein 1-like [Acomys russatus]|uniref:cysteine-rich secretory protein 1-like n=1 Tax=Acomys russatus TaxID=60746 RepID=UPI0021E30AFF|nr:cysteine-rich secretory protein 1-like [Acomys russatus]